MLTFRIKKDLYKKIKTGEKKIEYRKVTPYWSARIANEVVDLLVHSKSVKQNASKSDIEKFYFECLEKAKKSVVDKYVFREQDGFYLPCVFLGYGKSDCINAIITEIEIIDGATSDLQCDGFVYAMKFEKNKYEKNTKRKND